MGKFDNFGKARIVDIFRNGNFDRMGPLGWVFVFALGFLFVGLVLEVVRVLALIGGLVLIIYIAGAVVFSNKNIKKA